MRYARHAQAIDKRREPILHALDGEALTTKA